MTPSHRIKGQQNPPVSENATHSESDGYGMAGSAQARAVEGMFQARLARRAARVLAAMRWRTPRE